MSDDDILSVVKTYAENAKTHAYTTLDAARREGARAYRQELYGTEEEGMSSFVTSEVMDAVEWMKPALLRIFTSTDSAVKFDPTGPEDVKACEQATAACNYVFYKQNNGFMVLHTAFADSLIKRNCAVMWRVEEYQEVTYKTLPPTDLETLAMGMQLLNQGKAKAEIVGKTKHLGPDGVDHYSAKIRVIEKKKRLKIEAFEPEDLFVHDRWTSPELGDCPYVARRMRVTLSDIREMGFDVEPGEMADDYDYRMSGTSTQILSEDIRSNRERNTPNNDESMREGDLLYEFVLVDYDGDGIAERRLIIRLPGKILYNEPCDDVQIATCSPLLIPHSPVGLGMWDLVGDIQKLKTELTRQSLDSAYLANAPRMAVLQTEGGEPKANIDDLLSVRAGGIVREYVPGAVRPLENSFTGAAMFPLMEYADVMRERKTGITSYNQGLDANTLNKTATGITAIMGQSQQRIELVARIYAECLVKPIFKGILRLLVNSDMEQQLAFRLNNEFVQYDPKEWRDQYDMTITVGLGTGNKDQQLGHLQTISQNQTLAVQGGFLGKLVTLKNIYNTQSKMAENAGFKDAGEFWTNPDTVQEQPQQPKPDPEMMKLQQQAQLETQRMQNEAQIKSQATQAQTQADIQREVIKQQGAIHIKELELQAQREGINVNGAVQIEQPDFGRMSEAQDNSSAMMQEIMAGIAQSQAMMAQMQGQTNELLTKVMQVQAAPRQIQLQRDQMGRATGAVSAPVVEDSVLDQQLEGE